jgi:sugar phosphate permease
MTKQSIIDAINTRIGKTSYGAWTIGEGDWRWLFRIPPLVTAAMAVLVVLIPRETPEEAGYPGLIHDELNPGDTGTRVSDCQNINP